LDQLKELGWSVHFDGHRDYTQLRPTSDPPVGKLLNTRYVSAVTESVAASVQAQLEKGSLALTLGGDHSVALGTFSGTARVYPDAALIWIDAHAVSRSVFSPFVSPSTVTAYGPFQKG
jgi:arginase